MLDHNPPHLSAPLIHAVEDAILLGNIQEIDGLLDMVREDETFPAPLRYGLEALMYFRMFYGKGGDLHPANENDRQAAAQIESAWGRELIESIGHYPDLTEAKYA